MSEFCLPAVQLLDFVPEYISYNLPPLVYQLGIRNIMRYWAGNNIVIPDVIYQPLNTQVCVNPASGRSRVICKTSFKGTKILDVDIGDIDRKIIRILSTGNEVNQDQNDEVDKSQACVNNGNAKDAPAELDCRLMLSIPIQDTLKAERLQALLQHRKGWEVNMFCTKQIPKPMHVPVTMSHEIAITLYLDENFRIDRLEFFGADIIS
jgi:hypothetical protein